MVIDATISTRGTDDEYDVDAVAEPPEACGTLAGGTLVINRPAAGARDSGPRRLGGRRASGSPDSKAGSELPFLQS